MSKYFKIVLGLITLAIVIADDDLPLWSREFEPTSTLSGASVRNTDDKAYRLPENVIPLEYDIYIDLFFEERTEKPFSFEGKEYITIQVRLFILFLV